VEVFDGVAVSIRGDVFVALGLPRPAALS